MEASLSSQYMVNRTRSSEPARGCSVASRGFGGTIFLRFFLAASCSLRTFSMNTSASSFHAGSASMQPNRPSPLTTTVSPPARGSSAGSTAFKLGGSAAQPVQQAVDVVRDQRHSAQHVCWPGLPKNEKPCWPANTCDSSTITLSVTEQGVGKAGLRHCMSASEPSTGASAFV